MDEPTPPINHRERESEERERRRREQIKKKRDESFVKIHSQSTPPLPPSEMLRLLLLLLLAVFFVPAIGGRSGSDSLRLKLIRNPPSRARPRIDHFRDLIESDRRRHGLISAAIDLRRRPDCEGSSPATSSFAMAMSSGAYAGTGQYFVRFRVGTPAQRFLLVADTGSDLTWMKCRYRRKPKCRFRCGSGRKGNRVFAAYRSSSFHPIRCGSEMCKTSLPFSLTTCPTPATPCAYDYAYSDGSTAQGFFANESATITLSTGRRTKLKNLLIGCTSSFSGSSFSAASGVLGLGFSPISFASSASSLFSSPFSYCLVDHLSPKNTSGFLSFGPSSSFSAAANAQSTPLLLDPHLQPFYAVSILSLSLAGETLQIPSEVWNVSAGGGVIIDSGTSLTVLTDPAYNAITTALAGRFAGIPRVHFDPFEYCYNWTHVEKFAPPELAVNLAESAKFVPPAKSYVIDVAEGVKCIGFVSAPWPGVSTIGNILQQEHVWEFDVKNRRLRFQPSTCHR